MNDTPGWNSPGSAPSDGQDGSAPQWAKDQPPAGQWSPPPGGPTPPPPPPGHGWGNLPPQRGWGGYGPPQAPKPGVIPLRPLGVGEILGASLATLGRHWRTVLAVTVPVAVVTQAALVLVQRHLSVASPPLHADAPPAEQLEALSSYLRASLTEQAASMLLSVAASVFVSALLTIVVGRAVLGRSVTLSEAWREAAPRLPQLLVLSLALPLGAGLLAFVAMLPGLLLGGAGGAALAVLGGTTAVLVIIWLLIRFSLASPALMLERQGIIPALKRSAKLVDGSWWRIFGITMLTQLLVMLFMVLLAIPFTPIAAGVGGIDLGELTTSGFEFSWTYLIVMGISGVIGSALAYPVTAGVAVLLYVDQRIRREALDLELIKAAGSIDN
ncbi:hypothetical protein [Streptomyces sp. CC208A]|uniref:hypothetical protein n=1 Tax=Streptomyces sp. CC208A TaxID=3044573 RepID=UPI0024A7B834|nr:hypothetical protein [Streptomyces sp. CC208A]